MKQHYTTAVPNILFDEQLTTLKPTELKVLLIIIRQTIGWRKEKDWIASTQFQRKTGLSRKAISLAIASLTKRGRITVHDKYGHCLTNPEQRKGKKRLFYSYTPKLGKKEPQACVNSSYLPENKVHITKETLTKLNSTKLEKLKGELEQAESFEQLMVEKGIMKLKGNTPVVFRDRIGEYNLWKEVYQKYQI